jgi:isopropylmalate/homocitrate/citramalate synthase
MPDAIEPYSSELVGATRGIVLGKKSGLDSIRLKAEMLGVELEESRRAAVLQAVKRAAIEKGRLITDEEFLTLVRQTGSA